jgi:glutamyl-tRNA synthetase
MSTVRCRIAPSPSGFLHIGTAKMALFNWLFARKHGGTFVLRLEDTDAERTEEAFVQAMCEGFHWLGIDWDEGPQFGDIPEKGPHAPYRQSARKGLHQQEGLRLLAEGKAYKCFCTKEELDAMRAECEAQKRPPRYNGQWRDASPEQVAAMGDAPYVVRFRVPEGVTEIPDVVQGTVRIDNKELDDFVILKSNGDPIFHLAVVVDDGTMGITHVIRGDDHLTNAVRHVLLFNALGYALPVFAHLPMVLDEQGKKFSKRLHGANVLDWRDDGYLPEALINYVALLGWTPAEAGRELFSREELVAAFDHTRWGKSAAKFDRKKLDWLNGQHIRRLPLETLRDRAVAVLEREGFDLSGRDPAWLLQMAAICQEKIATLNQIVAYTDFFFRDVTEYEEKAVRKQWGKPEALENLQRIRGLLAAAPSWTHDAIKEAFDGAVAETEQALGSFVHPVRLALTGKSVGPGLFELMGLLGQDACLARLDAAMAHVATLQEANS